MTWNPSLRACIRSLRGFLDQRREACGECGADSVDSLATPILSCITVVVWLPALLWTLIMGVLCHREQVLRSDEVTWVEWLLWAPLSVILCGPAWVLSAVVIVIARVLSSLPLGGENPEENHRSMDWINGVKSQLTTFFDTIENFVDPEESQLSVCKVVFQVLWIIACVAILTWSYIFWVVMQLSLVFAKAVASLVHVYERSEYKRWWVRSSSLLMPVGVTLLLTPLAPLWVVHNVILERLIPQFYS